ncbi:unnamed protein product [Cuscuta campestris]|uniref:Uncharacterized protein n=1 Tax=Cuscuta campestris TaxID=132261 RepID=A0A484LCD6_9ASTE|nr:unnamed protein product [Cuscuta campestris]
MRKPVGGNEASAIEPSPSGFVINPYTYSQLSLEERRELLYGIYQWSDDAPKVLSSLGRRQLLEIICAEMGKERKYPGFTKARMIEHLLKLFSCRRTINTKKNLTPDDHPCEEEMKDKPEAFLCQNSACRAVVNDADVFCRRCSCCICHRYDDNKDPSLWLVCCSSDCPEEPGYCGLSCHLRCSLSHERSGILLHGPCLRLDGQFYCVSCGKTNDLMGTLRKQLVRAKEARRVDNLCLRISLSHKILQHTEKHKGLLQIVESAVDALEDEVGPLERASEKMDRSIVNRLSCGSIVQQLCASAIEAFDASLLQPPQSFHQMKTPHRELGEGDNVAESMNSSDNKTESPSKQKCSAKKRRVVPAPASPRPVVNKRQEEEGKEVAKGYEYSVGVIKKLESEGHIETDFRVKFLTWFSLKATAQERMVVGIFIDTFIDDLSSLAGQLMHTFMDKLCGGGGKEEKEEEEEEGENGHTLCTTLWH